MKDLETIADEFTEAIISTARTNGLQMKDIRTDVFTENLCILKDQIADWLEANMVPVNEVPV